MIQASSSPDGAAGEAALLDTAASAFLNALAADQVEAGRRRFDAAGPRLLARLRSVYGRRADFDAWFVDLCGSLGASSAERPAPLRALDAEREQQPDWFLSRRLLGYTAYVDRFAGTLSGVGERIPHLRDLGVGYLHLLPFLRAREGDSDGGFAVANFEEIEPSLGDMDDLQALTAALREDGISLCADFVLNHVADTHPWAQAARAGKDDFRAWFHVFSDRAEADAWERDLGQVFPEAAPGNFSFDDALGGWVWTTFYPFQWDLNYAHPPVFGAMAQTMVRLANRGVEVFRLDSAPYLWKRRGTACINEPEVHELLAALRAVAELCAPAILLKAEAITPTPELMPYFGQGERYGHECHLAYHSSLMASAWAGLGEGRAELVRDLLAAMPEMPPNTGWLTYVRCHDDIVWGVLRADIEAAGGDYARRIGAAAALIEGRAADSFGHGAPFQYAEGEPLHGSNGMTASLLGLPDDPAKPASPEALRRFAMMYGLAFWAGAIPMIYMGDEQGQRNNDAVDDAARLRADGRWMQRPRFSERHRQLAEAGEGVPAQTRSILRELVRARSRLERIDRAPIRVINDLPRGLLGLRRGDDELALFHFGRGPVAVDLQALAAAKGWSDLWAGVPGDDEVAAAGSVRTLPAWGMLWRTRG